MKYLVLELLCLPIIIFFKFLNPAKPVWGRIYYTSRLKADLSSADFSTQCDGLVYVGGTKNIHIGKRCRFGKLAELETVGNGQIYLGDDIRLNRGCTITSYSKISIGDHTIVGEFVSIRDANHGMKRDVPMRYQKHTSLPIKIGRDVWIARGSCILPGVTIGDGSVIGANSVVNKEVPPYSIAAGAPIKIIRARE